MRRRYAKALRSFALGLPGAAEEFPWGDRVVKVNKKIFAFLPGDEASATRLCVKLADAHPFALSLEGAAPAAYGLGRAGWVTIDLDRAAAPPDLLQEFIEESYRLIAPKRLIAELDEKTKKDS
jgi:predicted DNA-binding protein (MmcQ/YjbR family)